MADKQATYSTDTDKAQIDQKMDADVEADQQAGEIAKKGGKKKTKVAIKYQEFGDAKDADREENSDTVDVNQTLEQVTTVNEPNDSHPEDEDDQEHQENAENEQYTEKEQEIEDANYQQPAELTIEEIKPSNGAQNEIEDEDVDEKRDITDDICEIQFKCLPLLKDYRHNKVTILAYIDHQTQLLKSLDTRLDGGKAFIVSLINTLVDYVMLLDNTLLSKQLTVKLHVIALKYSYVLKDSLDNVLDFLERRRAVLYHQEQMGSEEKIIIEVQFNRILRDIELNQHIRECAPEKCSSLEQEYNLFSKLYPYYLKKGISEFSKDQAKLTDMFREAISVCNKMLFQTSYRFSFEKNGVHETKTFSVNREESIMLDFPEIYYPVSILLNELLIRPDFTEFHQAALTLIRRIYFYFDKIRESLSKPIMILMTNIRMFGNEECKKHAAIFLYQLVHQVNDSKIIELLDSKPAGDSDENDYQALLEELTTHKLYSVQALAYPNDIDHIVDSRNPHLDIGLPLFRKIESGAFFTLNFVIKSPKERKTESNDFMLYWKFKTEGHDIGFGIYKMNEIRVRSIDMLTDPNNASLYHPIIPLQRVDYSHEYKSGSIMFNMPGYYKVIFDNTYSYFRAKDLQYSVVMLAKDAHLIC